MSSTSSCKLAKTSRKGTSDQAYLDVFEDFEQSEYSESAQNADASKALGGHIQSLPQALVGHAHNSYMAT